MEAFNSLSPVLVLLLVGILSIILMRPLRLSPIVGYLLAGILIGPHGIGLVQESSTTHLVAELGVVFLLFDIGLHFSLGHIWDARKDILGLGPAQMILCTAAFSGIAVLAGFNLEFAIIVGATLALSSTAVAVQIMADHSQQHCPVGVSATSVLIFQDICAIFLLILASSMADSSASLGNAVGMAALKAVAAFIIAIFAGRYLIGPLFRLIARFKDEETFTATALLIVLATAAATAALELSLTLGAFLAGMIISETPYRHIIQTEVKPFRGLLLGFFFITVGMALNTEVIINQWWVILLTAMVLLIVKTLFIFLAARILRTPTDSALQMGVLLAQGSEFAFVIFAMPAVSAALGSEISAMLITAVAASMALTPPLVALTQYLANRHADQDWKTSNALQNGQETSETPIIIIGMGEIGQRIADGLSAHGIPYRAIEKDHDQFVQARADGYQVGFGNATDLRLMETIRIAHADTIAVTFANYSIAKELSPIVQARYPNLTRIVAVETEAEQEKFNALGMLAIIQHTFPKGMDIAAIILQQHSVEHEKIEKWMQRQQELELMPAQQLELG